MASLKDLTGGAKPVIAYPKTIQFGPVSLDGFMLEDGSFRQAIRSTGRALGMLSNANMQNLVARLASASQDGQAQKPVTERDLSEKTPQKPDFMAKVDPLILPVKCPGVGGHGAGVAYTINLPMVVEIWKQIAMGGGKYSRPAVELFGLSAVHSLERTYQEAFGVKDTRSTNDRLLDWAIRLDAGKHFPMFGGEFNKHFARVTGRSVGYDLYSATCMADLVYHRLPEKLYETLKDLNPQVEGARRQHSYSQLMSDECRQMLLEIVAVVKNQLANTPSKADDPKAYKKLLKRLDATLPRYKTRANHAGGNLEALQRWREQQKNV
jgi:hypothetical protein